MSTSSLPPSPAASPAPAPASPALAPAGAGVPASTALLPPPPADSGRASSSPSAAAAGTTLSVLMAISLAHFFNDLIQALLPSIYPVLQNSYQLSFSQLGIVTLTFQCTASLLQPVVGLITDRRSMPWSLPVGMAITLGGLLLLATANNYPLILAASALVGLGSSVFHPEASRIAHMAAGQRRGLAQSLFQVGGNAGTSVGPLLAAAVIVPHGQQSIAAFSLVALAGVILLAVLGSWQKRNQHRIARRPAPAPPTPPVQAKFPSAAISCPASALPRRTVVLALTILAILIFSKYFYLVSLTNYYTFYLMDKFHLSVKAAQYYLFIFLFAVAAGTILGGPVGDRFGRRKVIWFSILGVAPFSLLLPHASLPLTAVLSVIIGLILASAFSAILVYAQDLIPGRVGMIAGLFFGFAFGMAGIGAALLGLLADHTSIAFVFKVCAWLPLLGILTALLPDNRPPSASPPQP